MSFKDKYNILHFERKFPGSTETFIVNQMNTLPWHNHSVLTVDFVNELESIAKVYYPPKRHFFSDKILLSDQIKFFDNKISKVAPDIIHSHFITDACVFRPISKKLRIPKICSCYGYDVSVVPVKYKRFYKFFYKPIVKEYDLFLAMTDEMKKDLLEMQFPEEKILVHYHGVDTTRFKVNRDYSLSDGRLNILTVASLLEVKGHETTLKALHEAKKNHPEFKFHFDVLGAGPLLKELSSLSCKLGLSESVKFHGEIRHGKRFMEIMKKANVFAHPSIVTKDNDKEGIPGAIVEALASGLPVIATYHGGIPFVIKNRTSGFLIKEKDYQKMASLFYHLYKDFELRKRIGNSAMEYAQHNLDLKRKTKDLEQIYRTLIKN